jgi:hypothetical protein
VQHQCKHMVKAHGREWAYDANSLPVCRISLAQAARRHDANGQKKWAAPRPVSCLGATPARRYAILRAAVDGTRYQRKCGIGHT